MGARFAFIYYATGADQAEKCSDGDLGACAMFVDQYITLDLPLANLGSGLKAGASTAEALAAANKMSRTLWALNKFVRGDIIDEMLGNNLGHNFKTFDIWDPVAGRATSIKSMNLTDKSYQNPGYLKRQIQDAVDETVNFSSHTSGGFTLDSKMIKHRDLKVAIPPWISGPQMKQMSEAFQYGASKHVRVEFVVIGG